MKFDVANLLQMSTERSAKCHYSSSNRASNCSGNRCYIFIPHFFIFSHILFRSVSHNCAVIRFNGSFDVQWSRQHFVLANRQTDRQTYILAVTTLCALLAVVANAISPSNAFALHATLVAILGTCLYSFLPLILLSATFILMVNKNCKSIYCNSYLLWYIALHVLSVFAA